MQYILGHIFQWQNLVVSIVGCYGPFQDGGGEGMPKMLVSFITGVKTATKLPSSLSFLSPPPSSNPLHSSSIHPSPLLHPLFFFLSLLTCASPSPTLFMSPSPLPLTSRYRDIIEEKCHSLLNSSICF